MANWSTLHCSGFDFAKLVDEVSHVLHGCRAPPFVMVFPECGGAHTELALVTALVRMGHVVTRVVLMDLVYQDGTCSRPEPAPDTEFPVRVTVIPSYTELHVHMEQMHQNGEFFLYVGIHSMRCFAPLMYKGKTAKEDQRKDKAAWDRIQDLCHSSDYCLTQTTWNFMYDHLVKIPRLGDGFLRPEQEPPQTHTERDCRL